MRRDLAIAVVCFLLAGFAGCTRTEIVQPENFIEDPVFLAYCLAAKDLEGNLTIDLDGDGKISIEEAVAVEEIQLENEGGENAAGVRSMAGIEYFTNLRRLNVGNNSIQTLDLSTNTRLTYLNCSNNALTSIKLPANCLIETLNCSGNNLDKLDVSRLSALKYLYCAGPHIVESEEDVENAHGISRLDLSGNPLLLELVCDRNKLTSLDVSGCPELTDLLCGRNNIETLVLPSAGESSLVRLDCSSNRLKELDVAGQGELYLLRANDNPLGAIDISGCSGLGVIEVVACLLPELDITAAPNLRSLSCNGNPDGMNIYVSADFDSQSMQDWNIGTATAIPNI
jgi:Leucine-rich repeat (LRR) protein